MKTANATRDQEYDLQVARMRHSAYLDYPAHIHLETLAVCNARCSFCPAGRLQRKGTKMSDALLDKLLDQLAGFPRTLPFQLSPFKVNEPLLDPRMPAILRRVDEQLPQAMVTITTNGSVLTDEIINDLAHLKTLRAVWISLNEHAPEAYSHLMRLPQQPTLERLDLLHRRKQCEALPWDVVLSRVVDGTPRDAEFARWSQARYPAFRVGMLPRGNWLEQVDEVTGAIPRAGCTRWFELSITATGVVAHCCMDGQAAYPIGDVTLQSVLDVYNSLHWRRFRERSVWREHVEPCARCTFL